MNRSHTTTQRSKDFTLDVRASDPACSVEVDISDPASWRKTADHEAPGESLKDYTLQRDVLSNPTSYLTSPAGAKCDRRDPTWRQLEDDVRVGRVATPRHCQPEDHARGSTMNTLPEINQTEAAGELCSASTEPRFDVNGRPSLEGESWSRRGPNCRCMVSDVTPSTLSATSEHARYMFDRMCRATMPNPAEHENRAGVLSRKNLKKCASSRGFHRVHVEELSLAFRGRKRPVEAVTSKECAKATPPFVDLTSYDLESESVCRLCKRSRK